VTAVVTGNGAMHVAGVVQWCCSGVAVVLQWCCGCVAVVLECCGNGVAVVLQWCCSGAVAGGFRCWLWGSGLVFRQRCVAGVGEARALRGAEREYCLERELQTSR